jgi:hypothetical protein
MKNNPNTSAFACFLLGVALFCSSLNLHAGNNTILLKSGTLKTSSDFSTKMNEVPLASEIFNGNYYRLL